MAFLVGFLAAFFAGVAFLLALLALLVLLVLGAGFAFFAVAMAEKGSPFFVFFRSTAKIEL